MRRRLPKEHLRGWQSPSARAHRLLGRGVLPRGHSLPKERLRGMVAPIGAGPPTWGTGSPAQEAVASLRAPTGDGSPYRRGPIT